MKTKRPIFRHVLPTVAAGFALCAALALLFGLPAAQAQDLIAVPGTPMRLHPPSGSGILTRDTPGEKAKHSSAWFLTVSGPATNGYRTNFGVTTEPASPGVTYDASSGVRMKSEMKKGFPTSQLMTAGPVSVGGGKGAYVAGAIAIKGHNIHAKVVQTVHAGRLYTITFTCDESVYRKQVGAFDRSVASIKWQ